MKPILFNTPMTRAVAEGWKTATRRIAYINDEISCGDGTKDHEFVPDDFGHGKSTGFICRRCGFGVAPPHSRVPCGTSLFRPRYREGDILYVREAWAMSPDILREVPGPVYKADFTESELQRMKEKHFRWKPSIHMPASIARIFLRVSRVGLQRLQDITSDQCADEGIELFSGPAEAREAYYISSFAALWDTTMPAEDLPEYGWDANPWVWVIEFEKCKQPEEE